MAVKPSRAPADDGGTESVSGGADDGIWPNGGSLPFGTFPEGSHVVQNLADPEFGVRGILHAGNRADAHAETTGDVALREIAGDAGEHERVDELPLLFPEGNAIPTAAREREIYLIALPALKAGAMTGPRVR